MNNQSFKQFHFIEELETETPNIQLGRYTSHTLLTDPRRLVFLMARYKFVSKMLAQKNNVIEIGCSDGFGSNIVKQTVGNLIITDFDERMTNEAKKVRFNSQINAETFNFLDNHYPKTFDAAYLLDVLEHIQPDDEYKFMSNISRSLNSDGICIAGMPSLESQTYASASSKEGHVNCKTGEDLVSFMLKFFNNCFLFSMNDEVLHTGYSKMAHYIIGMGVGPKVN